MGTDRSTPKKQLVRKVTAGGKERNMKMMGDYSKTLFYFELKDETAVIPEEVEAIDGDAFSANSEKKVLVETVVLPSTIKKIGSFAFSRMENLKSIHFPEGLQTIEAYAFRGCKSLSEIVLPASVTEIGPGAFQKCRSLTKVVMLRAVSSMSVSAFRNPHTKTGCIPVEAFSDCTSLEHFDIPEDTAFIGNLAFNNCQNLKSVHIPEGVTVIGSGAFKDCQNLKSIRIPETVTTIWEEAFSGCFGLEEVFLPASCVELGQGALPHGIGGWAPHSAKLSRINVAAKNSVFTSLEGVLYAKNGETLVVCPSQYDVTDYTVPEGVKEITAGAFEGCEKIKRVVFAHSVEKIGTRAFANMRELEEIVLPPDFPVLGEGVFAECKKLKRITWPKNLREIGRKCFEGTGIEELVIPETVESIETFAFAAIEAKIIRLPKTVKKISAGIFAGVPMIEVCDTIDSDAKPAAEHLDSVDGSWNGRVGFVGIHQEVGYLPSSCDTIWREHTIIVRSAEDDSEKYRIKMPIGEKRKVYCTYTSSWGKNGEFNFNAMDDIFKDLTAEAKLDYFFERLHWQAGLSEETRDTFRRYAARNATEIAARVFQNDAVDDLVLLEPFEIIKKKTIDERIEEAASANAISCKAWLLNWRNSNVPEKERVAKTEKQFKVGAPTVAELKKMWPNKKNADGGLTITGYNGRDIDACVPEKIGKTPVTAIGDCCFSSNMDSEQQQFLRTQLRTVEIPNSVVDVGFGVFCGCGALENVRLPENLKEISWDMFSGCKNLSVELPHSVEKIGRDAFDGCTMKSMTIPASVKEIDKSAFGEATRNGMTHLEAFEVDPTSTYFKSVDGVLFSADGKILVKYPQARNAANYEIPNGVTEISWCTFNKANALRSVTIPKTVKTIGEYAFCECSNLETVSMPEKLSTLECAFCKCTSLKEIVVPKGITTLQSACFSDCTALTKVVLPEKLKKIEYAAFSGCGQLSEINIPDPVHTIGERAFESCKSLKDITVSKNVTKIGYKVFDGCDNLTIHAPAESEMYIYAKKNGINVEKRTEE